MNKRELFNNRFARLDGLQFVEITPRSVSDVRKKDEDILDLIYSVSDADGLVHGDLAMFLSDKANPEVKSFIQANLMQENLSENSSLSIPTSVQNAMRGVINDDDIVNFSRHYTESKEDYLKRLDGFLKKVNVEKKQEKEKRRIMKLLDGNGHSN